MTRRLLTLIVAFAPFATLALLPAGAAHAETVWYHGHDDAGRGVLLELETTADPPAVRGRLLDTPPSPGEPAGWALRFGAPLAPGDRIVVATVAEPDEAGVANVRGDAASATDDGPAGGPRLTIEADAARGGAGAAIAPDPFGEARVTLGPVGGADARHVTLRAIGTGYRLEATLDDGSFEVAFRAPHFYADPWRGLRLVEDPALRDEALEAGLSQRRDRPRSVSGAWWESRTTRIASLSEDLVSVWTEIDAYTGGAHPNLWFDTATWRRDGDAWIGVDACEALGVLGRPCDPVALRALVAADLRAQGAAWAESGEVDAGAPWLLGPFVVEPTGLRFLYAPYEVGPYADGPYEVVVPFGDVP